MTKATHNGNCQCCGRLQAVSAKDDLLAQHGYTVDWGFFNGVCSGANRLPLQLDRTVADAAIAKLREFAAEMAALTVEQIDKVPVEFRGQSKADRRVEWMDRAAYAAHNAGKLYFTSFEDKQGTTLMSKQQQGRNAAAHADELAEMADRLHGQPLIVREVEAPLRREYVKSYREAYARCEELKAAGKRDVRQRRERHFGFVLTYRD